MFHQLTILGPGLIGGSLAVAARERRIAGRIVCWSRSRSTREKCAAQPWCDRVEESAEDSVAGSDLVIVCTPVETIAGLVRQVSGKLEPGALVTDVGSTKARVVAGAAEAIGAAGSFIGSHPMAGSEKTGLEHARGDLFTGRACLVTPLDGAPAAAVARLRAFWEAIGMRVTCIGPAEHDRIVAHISHLPHLIAAALGAALAGTDPQWAGFGAGGLRDTTRVAAGDPVLWREIFEHNRDEVLVALERFEAALTSLRAQLANSDFDALQDTLAAAKAYRDALPEPPC